jgi:hypothetical protein
MAARAVRIVVKGAGVIWGAPVFTSSRNCSIEAGVLFGKGAQSMSVIRGCSQEEFHMM